MSICAGERMCRCCGSTRRCARIPAERARLLNSADVAFLCLPDAAARESVALIGNPATCVIDTSTAHRVDPAWAYGLPELAPEQRARIRGSKRIANPGCHATAFILAVRPLVDAGLLPADWPVSATSHTGYSGGGKQMIAQYREALAGLTAGAALAGPADNTAGMGTVAAAARWPVMGRRLCWRHVPMHWGWRTSTCPKCSATARWTGYRCSCRWWGRGTRGWPVSVPLDLAAIRAATRGHQTAIDRAAIHAALAARYAGEPFVTVQPLALDEAVPGGFFDVQGCNGTNRADLFVLGNDDQCVLMARIDNLGKGASGAAVQAMNIHLGLDETLGLV